MTLITYKPRTNFVNEIDNWFDSLWDFNYLESDENKLQPRFDISQDKTSYFITADLPGINKKDLEISLSDEMIKISGERASNENCDDEFSRYNNIQYGSFEKSFYIPDNANIDKINAKMENGVLILEIKKAKKISKNIKKISIK